MVRLSTHNYLRAHSRLKRYWDHQEMAYGYLSPQEQWQLHDFFQPSHDLSEEQLLAHRVRITAERPALPAQAGRALAKIDEIAAELAVHQVRARKRAAQPKPGGKRTNQRSKNRRSGY